MSQLTPSQTIGPFFHEGLKWAIQPPSDSPDTIRVNGQVLDRDGKPVNDALIEVWQPAWGEPPFGGLQRVISDDIGRFAFLMPKPGGGQAHASVTVFARGLLHALFTRVYLQALLSHTNGNQTSAAKLAGLDRSYLGRLLVKHGLSRG